MILGGLDYPFEWLLGDLAIRLEAPETFSVWRRDPSSPAQRRYRPRSRSFRGGVEKVYGPAVVQPAFYGDGQNIREIVRRSKGDEAGRRAVLPAANRRRSELAASALRVCWELRDRVYLRRTS